MTSADDPGRDAPHGTDGTGAVPMGEGSQGDLRPSAARDSSVREEYVREDYVPQDYAITDADRHVQAQAQAQAQNPDDSPGRSGQPGNASDQDWRDLQARFVDDPRASVEEAAALVERELAELRARLGSGSTEDLRTAFRRYRGLHESLG